MKRPFTLLSAVLLIGTARIAPAQAPASGEPTRVELSGTIGKVARGGIEVSADSVREVAEGEKKAKTKAKAAPAKSATAEKQTVLVAIQASTMIRVSGSGPANKVLRPGQYVQFDGKIEDEKVIKSIGNLAVVVPDNKFQPKFEVRVPPPKFGEDTPVTKTKDFSAEGRVVGYSRGRLLVAVQGGKQVSVPLAEATDVNFTSTSFSTARPGDKISVEGRQARPGQVTADTVNITLSNEEPKPKAKEKEKPKDFSP
jgi:hypothetical protein